MKSKPGFTGQQAMFLNLKEDGKKIRSATFKDKTRYDRKKDGSKSLGRNE